MRRIPLSAWRLVLLSAALQIVIFPLPNLYWLSWVAVAPLLLAILRVRPASALQLDLPNPSAGLRHPATPWQGFLLGYLCGMLWFAGTCYWVFDVMHEHGGLPVPAALGVLVLFCMYVGLYHGFFGCMLAIVANTTHSGAAPSLRRALAAAPFLWVAVELARTRITAFPWELLGYSQTANFPLARIATITGVYGLSFEIVLVNSVFAASFLAPKGRRRWLLTAACAASLLLQAGRWLAPPPVAADRRALLVQPNIPIQDGALWTTDYFQSTLRELSEKTLHPFGNSSNTRYDLVVWPESPAPFYTNDPLFRNAVSDLARQSATWVIAGSIGITPAVHSTGNAANASAANSQIFNSAALVSPQGLWMARYDKIHLVPFGEYLPFPQLFSFAGGLTKEVGEFQPGSSRVPLDAGGQSLGLFICYESIFPDEVRLGPRDGAQVLVNISNDGWYGDSGAWKQHLQQTRMRAIENERWLLAAANTGKTAAIDPFGRIVAESPRNLRTGLAAPYALLARTTFYTRHGDWFAYLCAIISVAALLASLLFPGRKRTS